MPITNINPDIQRPLGYTPDLTSFSISCLSHCGLHQAAEGGACSAAHCNGHATGGAGCVGHRPTCSTNRAISNTIKSTFDLFEPIRASHINALRTGIRAELNSWKTWYDNKYGVGSWNNSFNAELGDVNPLNLLTSSIFFRAPTGIDSSENKVKAQQKNDLNTMMYNLDIILEGLEYASQYSVWQPGFADTQPGDTIRYYGSYGNTSQESPDWYPRHWEYLLYIYDQIRTNCVCNSDCACNIVCVCHNNCGCNYSDQRLKKEIQYC
jgi:hypothetical protein